MSGHGITRRVRSCKRCGEELVANTLHVCDVDAPLLRLRPAAPAPTTSGVGRIVVGYRPGDRRVIRNLELYGLEAHAVRRCYAGCGYPVLFYSGGVDAVTDRDAEVVCMECKTEFYADLIAEL